MSDSYEGYYDDDDDDLEDDDGYTGYSSDYGDYDDYDDYEDRYIEEGYDPYGVFDDSTSIERAKLRAEALLREIRHIWKWHTNKEYRQHYGDIPF